MDWKECVKTSHYYLYTKRIWCGLGVLINEDGVNKTITQAQYMLGDSILKEKRHSCNSILFVGYFLSILIFWVIGSLSLSPLESIFVSLDIWCFWVLRGLGAFIHFISQHK
ncbi:hypothetical protein ACJX0J_028043, partial [Zea mays]